MPDTPDSEVYQKDLVLALRDYGMALRVDPNADPEPYVGRFPPERRQEVRRTLVAEGKWYRESGGQVTEELLLIMRSPDLSLGDRLFTFFRRLEEYKDEPEPNEKQ